MSQADLRPEKEALLGQLFALVDTDRSGHVDVRELLVMVKLINPQSTIESLKKMFHGMDRDATRQIDQKEFSSYFIDTFASDTKEQFWNRIEGTMKFVKRKPLLSKIFFRYDIDQSKSLDRKEVLTMVRVSQPNLKTEEAEATFKAIDVNRDDIVDESEFVRYYYTLFKDLNDTDFNRRISTTFNNRRHVKLLKVFGAFDRNNNNTLDVKEFGAVLRAEGPAFVSDEEVLKTMAKLDIDRSRSIDFHEWMIHMEGVIAQMDDERFDLAVTRMIQAAPPRS